MSGKIVPPPPAAAGGKRSAWMMHVKKTMRANRGMSLRDALRKAAASYEKPTRKHKRRGGGIAEGAAPLTAGRRRRGSRKTRRS